MKQAEKIAFASNWQVKMKPTAEMYYCTPDHLVYVTMHCFTIQMWPVDSTPQRCCVSPYKCNRVESLKAIAITVAV